eukprot:GHVU01067774.1.p1 GENE.GHVU01067774.1~~GHVU01067774.1.p1  ORF type:complete len:130 (-),score=8.41 GHVU01067774.1:160-549(-)
MSERFRHRFLKTGDPLTRDQLDRREVGCKSKFWVDVAAAFNQREAVPEFDTVTPRSKGIGARYVSYSYTYTYSWFDILLLKWISVPGLTRASHTPVRILYGSVVCHPHEYPAATRESILAGVCMYVCVF